MGQAAWITPGLHADEGSGDGQEWNDARAQRNNDACMAEATTCGICSHASMRLIAAEPQTLLLAMLYTCKPLTAKGIFLWS